MSDNDYKCQGTIFSPGKENDQMPRAGQQDDSLKKTRLSGVVCDVTGCRFHDAVDCCTAHNIQVQGTNADTSSGTCCDTFAPMQ
ncbi:MAG: DUF1540 domain-containing protein [Oscillospiraceae bacterium]|jgi:hypothetical protein|nr:DUF1540 domain-containing protein [Oscillospiraceae bacterium]